MLATTCPAERSGAHHRATAQSLQLDRIACANINLWATLSVRRSLPIGRVFDRVGLRWTTAALSFVLALVVWRMSALTGGVTALFVLVLLTRAIGQSALSVASITAVGKSFGSRVGMAMGVYSVLLSVFFAAALSRSTAVRRAAGGWPGCRSRGPQLRRRRLWSCSCGSLRRRSRVTSGRGGG
jgi:hypothetical protein